MFPERCFTSNRKLDRENLHLVGAGVHPGARVQPLHLANYDSLDSIHKALNGLLPSDIRNREIRPAVLVFLSRAIFIATQHSDSIISIMDVFRRHYVHHSVYDKL
ncbi:hypothetical protein ACH5RR_030925 [Cinchona calisaya]|uniref:Uncharacterized protein n=1 Tax=Cinchona calisaya TaxID=153742 RepID=A0ABD2YDP7_9GENT